MIQLQRIEGFYWVARTQGYARAVRAFPYPITEPGVHQQVRRLERDLGVQLFVRAGKDRVVPTAAGQTLFDFVAPFYEGLAPLEEALRSGTHGGRLRIHAASLLVRQLLPSWLRRLQRQRPDIELVLSEVHVPDLAPIRHGQSDLLVDHLAHIPADIETRIVGRLHSFVALPSDHPLAKRKRPSWSQLSGETFIAYAADSGARSLQLRALERAGVRPGAVHGADSTDTILGFVAAGLGFSLVPWLAPGSPHVPGVVAHPVRMLGSTFPVHAAWKRGGPPHPLRDAALALAPSDG